MGISLIDALAVTEDRERPFQIKFVTFNKDKKTGGDIIELTKAVRSGAKYNLANNDMIAVRQLNNTNHPYPVHTHLILEINNQKIFL